MSLEYEYGQLGGHLQIDLLSASTCSSLALLLNKEIDALTSELLNMSVGQDNLQFMLDYHKTKERLDQLKEIKELLAKNVSDFQDIEEN